MASQHSTAPQLPTASLSPPETLLPPTSPTDLDPISLTISCIFASLALITFLLLLFKNPKQNYTDDTADDEPPLPPRSRFTPTLPYYSRPIIPSPPLSSAYTPRVLLDKTSPAVYYHGPARDHLRSSDPPAPHTQPPQHHHAQIHTSVSHPSYTSNFHFTDGDKDDDDKDNDDKDNDDMNTLNCEALYAEYRRRDLGTRMSMQRGVVFGAGRGVGNDSGSGIGGSGVQYAASFVPSEFVPLAPEAVGLHGQVWRAGRGGEVEWVV